MSDFQALYTGRLWSVMSWDQLTAFWGRVGGEGRRRWWRALSA